MTNLPWLDVAESFLGTKEVPGSGDNQVILDWAKALGGQTARVYNHDSIPWCALFVAYCLETAGSKVGLDNPLWAPSFANVGQKCDPCYGAIMTFQGHVAFYISEDANYYHILGGNQSDMVNVTRMGKGQFVQATWPKEFLHLKTTEPIFDNTFEPGA